jgi:hypothetical protein
MTDPVPPPAPRGQLGKVGAWVAGITALLIAATALFSQVPLLANAVQAAYCSIVGCRPPIKVFTAKDLMTKDGGGHRSGMMSGIKLSIISNDGNGPDSYVAQWIWSGSGGTQHGNQTVIIDLKSDAGATLQSIRIPLDRSHCYYPGNSERHEGKLTVPAKLISGFELTVTAVENTQDPC